MSTYYFFLVHYARRKTKFHSPENNLKDEEEEEISDRSSRLRRRRRLLSTLVDSLKVRSRRWNWAAAAKKAKLEIAHFPEHSLTWAGLERLSSSVYSRGKDKYHGNSLPN